MMYERCFFPILLMNLVLPFEVLSLDVSSLQLVHILHRHGDRSPTHTYPTDPYQVDAWPQGFGQLTKEGKMQMYQVGQFIKRLYIDTGFLSKTYKRTEIEVRSTDRDRTLMSAYLVLAGLYELEGRQLWNDKIPWQPIPVHSEPRAVDYLLALDCPAYDKLFSDIFRSQWVLNIEKKHKALIDYVSEHSGLNPTLFDLMHMIDPVNCEKIHDKKLPDWLQKDNTSEKILQLYDLHAQLKFSEPALARIKGGPLLGRMLENMREVVTSNVNESTGRKAFIYSGHDTTINAFLSALKIFNKKVIPTGTVVFVELHVIDKIPVVKILYRNDTSVDPYILNFTDCETPCPLAKLTKLTKDMIPEDPVAACQGLESKDQQHEGTSGTTIAVTILTVVIIMVVVCLLAVHKLRERSRLSLYRYSPVNQHM